MGSSGSVGELELWVLAAVAQAQPNAYGVTVRDALGSRGISRSLGAVYTTLSRLERKGFLSSAQGASTPTRGGRAKRLFQLEPAGRQAIDSALSARRAVLDLVNEVLQ